MSTFKVGQRVKNISDESHLPDGLHDGAVDIPVDSEGTVEEIVDWYGVAIVCVRFDRHPIEALDCAPTELTPLTDPRADEFIADMERFSIAAKKVTA